MKSCLKLFLNGMDAGPAGGGMIFVMPAVIDHDFGDKLYAKVSFCNEADPLVMDRNFIRER